MARAGMGFVLTGEGVAEQLGEIEGLISALDSKQFVSNMIDYGAGKAAFEFKKAAAEHTELSGALNHMYDWNTSGDGSIDVTKPLWRDHITKNMGTKKELYYNFIQSTRQVPTIPAYYGHKYVFRNKAMIMESGRMVTIDPKQSHGLLFLPTADTDKGFVLFRGSVTVTPGRKFAGNFESFWQSYFRTDGQDVFDESIEVAVQKILDKEQALMNRQGTPSSLKDLRYKVDTLRKAVYSRIMNTSAGYSSQGMLIINE